MRYDGGPGTRQTEILKTGFHHRDVGVLMVTVLGDSKETSVPAEVVNRGSHSSGVLRGTGVWIHGALLELCFFLCRCWERRLLLEMH